MRSKARLCGLLLALVLAVPSAGQPGGQEPSRRVVTTTRLVALFSGLESELMTAIQRKDKSALDSRLQEDFSLWTPAPPGAPLPREEWMAQALASSIQSFQVRQMAVQMAGDTAVVNFVLDQTASSHQEHSRSFFIVDLWKQAGDQWQLSTRYQAPLAGASWPGPKRPTGKE